MLNPFVLRSVSPAVNEFDGTRVEGVRRIGKQLVLHMERRLFVVIHLMIAGRLRWRDTRKPLVGKFVLASFEFPNGWLYLTEAGSKRRCRISLVEGEDALSQFSRDGLEPLDAGLLEFATRLRDENHTIKRALTDPRLFSGIGNAYSDEILHAARLSPLLLTGRISDEQVETLFHATQKTLVDWTRRLRDDAAGSFPDKVTAFHEEMAVHGKY